MLQTYSGHENKVKALIELKADEMGDDADIGDVVVPTQEVAEIRGGRRVTVTKRLYPGYVLVRLRLSQDTHHAVTSVPGVINFVGGGGSPQPLKPEEINKILGIPGEQKEEKVPEHDIPFHTGQVVEITDGPFSDFSGTVKEVLPEKGNVVAEVSLFGRPTKVELDYTQLKGY